MRPLGPKIYNLVTETMFGDKKNQPLFSNLSSAMAKVEPACKHEPTRNKIDDLVTK